MQVRGRFGVELSTLREEIRRRNYSIRTEHAYETRVMRYVTFHDGQDPRNLDTSKLQAYPRYLANTREVAASTQEYRGKQRLTVMFCDLADRSGGEETGCDEGGEPHARSSRLCHTRMINTVSW